MLVLAGEGFCFSGSQEVGGRGSFDMGYGSMGESEMQGRAGQGF